MAANVLIAPQFFSSLAELRPNDQARVIEFINTFQSNPAHPSLSLERVNRARSKGVWSGRVSGDLRAILHKDGEIWAILYADRMTESMKKAIGETQRRRERQMAHNLAHGITPRSIVKQVRDLIDGVYSEKSGKEAAKRELERAKVEDMSEKDVAREIKRLEKLMLEHARNLEFEKAARVRDQLAELREQAFGGPGHDNL